MTYDLIDALASLKPNKKWTWVGTDYSGLKWNDTGSAPTESELNTEVTRLNTEYNNKKYQRDRAAEYPPVVDQLDDIYHNGIDGWKATIKATKDKYPKS